MCCRQSQRRVSVVFTDVVSAPCSPGRSLRVSRMCLLGGARRCSSSSVVCGEATRNQQGGRKEISPVSPHSDKWANAHNRCLSREREEGERRDATHTHTHPNVKHRSTKLLRPSSRERRGRGTKPQTRISPTQQQMGNHLQQMSVTPQQ